MDLLGGKYDVATTNIPASYVNAIEVINHHHDRKIDKGIFSDNVALNVRLKKEAMFRPTGSYTLGAGLGKPIPLEASGAGMMFCKNFQSILTLKGTDIEEFSEREQGWYATTTDFDNLSDRAASVLPNLSGSGAPLRRVRYIKPVDAAASLNFMNKQSEDVSVRTNIDYAFRKAENDYSDSRLYFDGKGNMEIRQVSNPHTESHTPSVSNEYRINRDGFYFENEFNGKATFVLNRLPVTTPTSTITQQQKGSYFDLRENIRWSSYQGKWGWSVGGSLEYASAPKRKNRISEEMVNSAEIASSKIMPKVDEEDAGTKDIELHSTLSQEAKSHGFYASASASTMTTYKRARFNLPLKLSYSDESLSTFLTYADAPSLNGSSNRLSGKVFDAVFSPYMFLNTEYERLTLVVSSTFALKSESYRNSGTRAISDSGLRFRFSPDLLLEYSLSAKSNIGINATYATGTSGDLLNFLSSPVMTDYLSGFYRSGIMARSRNFNANIHYHFKHPISMWFVNTNVGYSNTHSNVQSSQDVSDGLILSGTVKMPSTSENMNAMASVTKNITSIKSKFTLSGSYSHSINKILQNDMEVKYFGDNWNASLSLSTNPLKWLEVGYNGSFSEVISRYLGQKQSFITNTHDINLSFFPVDALQLKLSADITNREIERNHYKTSNLFDFYASYTYKKLRFSLTLRNILDCRSYSYTVFNGLDRFNYDYSLRGRELVAKITFTL